MGGQQRIYKQRIASTTTLAKVFRAMEMIAASRIGAARRAATEAGPYEKALTQAVAAVAVHTDLDHPLIGPTGHGRHPPTQSRQFVGASTGRDIGHGNTS